MTAGAQVNRDRLRFIPAETIERVIAACPDVEWKLIIALSRYAGLRCPSEHLSLTWRDVDWDQARVTVRSPKTEGQSKASRMVPIFPELLPYLRDVYERAPEGTEYVITRYRLRNINLRTQFERILAKAGVEPWPRLFHNLRASRQTELASHCPAHVVCEWMGNSVAVAQAHYLQTTGGDFERAVRERTSDPKAAQKAAQSGAAQKGTGAPAAHVELHSDSKNDIPACAAGSVMTPTS